MVVYRDIFLQRCDIVIWKISYRDITIIYIYSSISSSKSEKNIIIVPVLELELK